MVPDDVLTGAPTDAFAPHDVHDAGAEHCPGGKARAWIEEKSRIVASRSSK